MAVTLEMSEELQMRVDAIARRSNLSASQVVSDALENGYSLDWQERFLDRVSAGIEAADNGEFANVDDLDRVINKYRPS